MTEKQASSEIAQSRERFEKWAETSPVMDHYGDRDVWDDIWLVAEATYIAAERDTRERCAQIAREYLKLWPTMAAELAERIRGEE